MADGSLYVSVKALPVKLRHKLKYSNQPAPLCVIGFACRFLLSVLLYFLLLMFISFCS